MLPSQRSNLHFTISQDLRRLTFYCALLLLNSSNKSFLSLEQEAKKCSRFFKETAIIKPTWKYIQPITRSSHWMTHADPPACLHQLTRRPEVPGDSRRCDGAGSSESQSRRNDIQCSYQRSVENEDWGNDESLR